MKNKKIILTIIAMIILVMAIVPCVKASDDGTLNIIENNETNNPNTENNVANNTENTENTNNGAAENKLPQTGVAEDTTLFVFIVICTVSAIYAYIKIRNYRNV